MVRIRSYWSTPCFASIPHSRGICAFAQSYCFKLPVPSLSTLEAFLLFLSCHFRSIITSMSFRSCSSLALLPLQLDISLRRFSSIIPPLDSSVSELLFRHPVYSLLLSVPFCLLFFPIYYAFRPSSLTQLSFYFLLYTSLPHSFRPPLCCIFRHTLLSVLVPFPSSEYCTGWCCSSGTFLKLLCLPGLSAPPYPRFSLHLYPLIERRANIILSLVVRRLCFFCSSPP